MPNDVPVWDLADAARWQIRLYPDVSCDTPMWNGDGVPGYPDELPLSEALQSDLLAWAERYNAADTAEHLYPENNPSFDIEKFNADGEVLADRLRAELGAAWTVSLSPVRRGPAGFPERPKPLPRDNLPPPRTGDSLMPDVRRAAADIKEEGTHASKPSPQAQPARRQHDEPLRSELRDGMMMLSLFPCYEVGFCYAIQPLWRGEHVLPRGLLRQWAITQPDLPDSMYVAARDPMFTAFTEPLLHGRIGRWESKHDDVSLTVMPAALSPYVRRYWSRDEKRWRIHDPPEDGFEINMLFRARQEAAFAPANSGVTVRLAVTRLALERFMEAFAADHRALNLKDDDETEETGRFVPLQFRWPPNDVRDDP